MPSPLAARSASAQSLLPDPGTVAGTGAARCLAAVAPRQVACRVRVTLWAAILFTVALSSLPIRAARAEINFGEYSIPVHKGPVGIAPSDCTGDGIADLIVASQNAGSVTILRNRGDGTFQFWKAVSIPVPPPGPLPGSEAGEVSSAVCGDLTGDGLADIVVAIRSNPGNLVILIAKASGGMTSLGALPLDGLSPNSVSAADLNHDDNLDLVVVNANSNDMMVLLGDGAGAFPSRATIAVPGWAHTNRPSSAAVADYNMDGNLDIAVASRGVPPIRLFFGDGTGKFLNFEGPLPTPVSPRGIAAADLDRDGVSDLVTIAGPRSSHGDSMVDFYRGTGTGTFVLLDSLTAPANTPGIALADFNGDGWIDLAIDYFKSNDVQVLFASGPARYTPPIRWTTARNVQAAELVANPPGAAFPRSIAGTTQLVSLNTATQTVDLVELPEPGAPLTVTPLAAVPPRSQTLLLADMNNDSIQDAVVLSGARSKPQLAILLGDSAGGYAPSPTPPTTATCGNGVLDAGELCDDGNSDRRDGCGIDCIPAFRNSIRSMTAGDLNGDGNNDLVLAAGSRSLMLLFGDGQGRIAAVRTVEDVRLKSIVTVADLNNDNALDIALVPSTRRGVVFLMNDGTGQFSSITAASNIRSRTPFLAADFDTNGFTDITIAQRKGAVVLYNYGDGPSRSVDVPTPRRLRAFAAADFDEDGTLDLLAIPPKRSKLPLMLHRSLASGDFAPPEARLDGDTFAAATVVDINDDSHQDIVLCDPEAMRSCHARFGDGRGHLAAVSIPDANDIGRHLRGLAAVDMDADGALDFISVSRRDKRAVIVFRSVASPQTNRVELLAGNKPHALAVGDMDADGKPDLVVANQASSSLSVFLNRGGRQFEALPPISTRYNPSALFLADLNGDGRKDIVVTLLGVSAVSRFLNVEDTFAGRGFVETPRITTGNAPTDVAVADLNGDGIPDLVTADRDANSLSLFLTTAPDTYERSALATGGSGPAALAVADLNGDSHPDLIVLNQRSDSVATLLNNGHGIFATAVAQQARGRVTPNALCIADFDGDGLPDVAIASHATQDILVLRGTGGGSWARDERVYQIGSDPVALACADIDADGRPDIVFGNRRKGTVDVLHNVYE